jgi:predicted AAA+ superfamily ATPase
MELIELNPWWKAEKIPEGLVPPTKRHIYNRMFKDLERRQIQILVGLRRVGKSTVLFQIIESLLEEGKEPLNIIYASFDEPEFQRMGTRELLKEYEKQTKVNYKQERIFLFLDEVQKSNNWVNEVKLLYDITPKLKLVLSVSASLNLLSQAKVNLAGRAIYYEMKPLSFPEFLELRGIRYDQERILLYKDALEKEFDSFMHRAFPEIVNERDPAFIRRYIRDAVIDPILFKDMPRQFEGVDTMLTEALLEIFLREPGQYLSIDELSMELGRAKKTLYRTLFYLEASFLLRSVYNYRPSVRAASRKLQRVYAYHPSLSIPYNIPDYKYAENLVLSVLDARFYWREGQKEVDFLVDSLPVEVKYKDEIKRNDTKWLKKFVSKYGGKVGYLITKNTEGAYDGIRLLPLWMVCLFGLKDN